MKKVFPNILILLTLVFMPGCDPIDTIHPCRPDETKDDRVGAKCIDGFTTDHTGPLACFSHFGRVHYLCD